jgi:hypothetical protein
MKEKIILLIVNEPFENVAKLKQMLWDDSDKWKSYSWRN